MDLVDGVDEVVESLVEYVFCISLTKECFDDGELAVGVNGSDSLCHGGCFLFANLAIHSVELSIDISDADLVEVDHGDLTYT